MVINSSDRKARPTTFSGTFTHLLSRELKSIKKKLTFENVIKQKNILICTLYEFQTEPNRTEFSEVQINMIM